MKSIMVVEIGVEVTPTQLSLVKRLLDDASIPYYIEPPRPKSPYHSLLDLEADCEGK